MAEHSSAPFGSGTPAPVAGPRDEIGSSDLGAADQDALRKFLAEGSSPAFASLTERYAGLVYGVAMRRLGQHELAEKVAFASMLAHANDPQFNIGWAEQAMVAIAPEQSLALSEKLTNKSLRESIRSAVAREYGRRDPLAAVTWARQQPDADALLPAVFQQLKEPPAHMIPALAELAPEVQKHILDKSWPWWERGDPFPTLAALRSAPENLSMESRQHLITRMMESMTRHLGTRRRTRRRPLDNFFAGRRSKNVGHQEPGPSVAPRRRPGSGAMGPIPAPIHARGGGAGSGRPRQINP